jgi:hypothetical protein
MALQAAFALALCVATGFAVGRFSAVVIPWLVLAGWSAYNLATAAPSAEDPNIAAGLFVLAMLGAFAATGVVLGVALRRATAARGSAPSRI